jgi:HlyD family secretion protein
MSLRKRLVLIVVGLLLLVLLALAFRPQPIPVDAVEVARGPMSVTIEQRGVTRVVDRYVVSAPVAAHAQRLALRVGDAVTSGETLLELAPVAPVPLDARSLAQAQARAEQAQAALAAAQAHRQAAAAAAEFAEARIQRAQRLFKAGDLPEEAFEQTRAAVLEARANLRSAEFNVQIARYELDAARAGLAYQEAGAAPREPVLALRAPVAGRVLAVHQQSEGVVAAGQPLLEIGDPAALEVAVDVLSHDAARLRPGVPVTLHRWGGAPLEAAVRRVEPAGFMRVSALGVEEQRVLVIVDVLSPHEQWRQLGTGYRVEARFVLWRDEDVLQVPEGALFRTPQGWAVFVLEGQQAQLRQVEPGARADLRAQILQGLAAGEEVIVHPDSALEPGQRVRRR